MIYNKNETRQTSIYVTKEMDEMKEQIEQTLDGATLNWNAICLRGLLSYKEQYLSQDTASSEE